MHSPQNIIRREQFFEIQNSRYGTSTQTSKIIIFCFFVIMHFRRALHTQGHARDPPMIKCRNTFFADINPQMKVSRPVNRDGMVRFFDGKCCQNDAYSFFNAFKIQFVLFPPIPLRNRKHNTPTTCFTYNHKDSLLRTIIPEICNRWH